jgi:hypothetical protein
MPEALTIRDFLPYLHTQFQIEQFEGYKLELTEVTEYSNPQLEQFSLIFTGTASPSVQQGMYTLVHPKMGKCELLLVPIGPDGAGMRYEAAFSRFIRTSGS